LASGWHVLLLLISTLVDWNAAKKISSSNDSVVRKRWLQASLIVNLGILGIFKYLDFLIQTWNWSSLQLTGAPEIDTLGLLLPIGISFYTFQTISYTIDVYWNKGEPYDDFLSFACYASLFQYTSMV
jgi:D-alanyl-lipoteichoic acid acyltransferase DltB (MBOAT superfamily)